MTVYHKVPTKTQDALISKFIEIVDHSGSEELAEKVVSSDFNEAYRTYVASIISPELMREFEYISAVFSEAFETTKKMMFPEAEEHFVRGQELIRRSSSSSDLIKYLSFYVHPRVAYYYYKKRKWTEASLATQKAIEYCELIEFEFPEMHLTKVQQYHNISRIYRARNIHSQAIELEIALIKFMLAGKSSAILPTLSTEILSFCRPGSVYKMLSQVFNEFVSFLSKLTKHKRKRLFLRFRTELSEFLPRSQREQLYLIWIRSIEAFYLNDIPQFYILSNHLFSVNTSEFDTLKCYTLNCFKELLGVSSFETILSANICLNIQSRCNM